MTRIPYRDPDSMTEQARALSEERGNLNVYRALANAHHVFTGWMIAGREALTSPVVTTRLRELVILRTAHLMDSPYEIAQHTPVAGLAGVNGAQVAALTSAGDLHGVGFDDTELAVLRLATELVRTRTVTAPLFEQVRTVLGDEATVEVLMLISRWAGLALMLNALEVDLDPDARIAIPPTTR